MRLCSCLGDDPQEWTPSLPNLTLYPDLSSVIETSIPDKIDSRVVALGLVSRSAMNASVQTALRPIVDSLEHMNVSNSLEHARVDSSLNSLNGQLEQVSASILSLSDVNATVYTAVNILKDKVDSDIRFVTLGKHAAVLLLGR